LPETPEQAALGLLEDVELGVLLVDTQLIEGGILCLLDGATGGLDPFH
jgi:hypothetical protein